VVKGQQSLFEPRRTLPEPLISFLAGMIAQWRYGEKPKKPQREAAREAAELCAVIIAEVE
jgi:hypothetical protein